jgi:ATP-dependent DNA helicase RecQ
MQYDNNLNNNLSYKMRLAKYNLKKYFGYDSFRKNQDKIIENILSNKDVIAIMPTGAGKSICYQIPALILDGLTIVISPLISLMQDQVKALKQANINAAYLNSTLSYYERKNILNNIKNNKYKLIYVAPERLIDEEFIRIISNIKVSLLAVDEAHCISQWGVDFRPDYLKIVDFVKKLKNRPIIGAFTATATKNVQDDILCILGLNNPFISISGFNRENLYFEVRRMSSTKKDKFVLDYVKSHENESGIIYCSTRKNVDELYQLLEDNHYLVSKYHAGMRDMERKTNQEDFVYEKTNIMVATNAFGMGIDKPNVRYVIHYNMPQSIENYYQEAGRAGRDSLPAKCILLYSAKDVITNEYLINNSDDNDQLSLEDKQIVKDRNLKKLKQIQTYCYTTDCLRNYILKYFGEQPLKPCEDCYNCNHNFETMDVTKEARQIINCIYELKERYGKGIVTDILLGNNNSKLEYIDTSSIKSYGCLSYLKKSLILKIIDQMIFEEYITIYSTNNYPILKLGDYSKLKQENAKVEIKIIEEDKKQEKTKNKNRTKLLSKENNELYNLLKKLRLEIAREENVPAYFIFDDKCLVDMAAKKPLTKDEMLNVSGVGNFKLEKYGERFLKVINDYSNNQFSFYVYK